MSHRNVWARCQGSQSQEHPTSRGQGGSSEALLTFDLSHQGWVGITWLQMRLERKEETYCAGLESQDFLLWALGSNLPTFASHESSWEGCKQNILWLAFVSV